MGHSSTLSPLGIGTITPLLFVYTYMRHPNTLHEMITIKERLTHNVFDLELGSI
jgi:hypothetical protein|eukprot:COSAG01_NODE_9818_length_2333_cov_2.599821_3_plen_54_part_00